MAFSSGARLGSYEISSLLGAGGMGEVYRARDSRLGREVAIKVIPGAFFEDKDRKDRFEREARALAGLNHPGIAVVHSFEEISGQHILVMELLEGVTLRERLEEGALPPRKAVDIAVQIANGLAAAHEKAIVHRERASRETPGSGPFAESVTAPSRSPVVCPAARPASASARMNKGSLPPPGVRMLLKGGKRVIDPPSKRPVY